MDSAMHDAAPWAGRPQANSMEAIIRQEAVLPRDAMCQSKLCQLLMQHNSVETSCTTNPEQIEVMELEGYSRQMCNKLCACSHDAVDRRKCNSQARPSTNLVDYIIDLPKRNCHKSTVCGKVPEGSTLILEIPEFPYNTV